MPDQNTEALLAELKKMEDKHLQEIAEGSNKDNHNGDSQAEREQ